MKAPRPPSEAEQRLKAEVAEMMVRDRVLLVQRQPFVGHLAMHLDLVPVIMRLSMTGTRSRCIARCPTNG